MQKAEGRTVLLDFRDPDYNCSSVLSNNGIWMYRAVQYLIDHGHRDIGFVGTMEASGNIRERFFAYRKCLEDNQLTLHPEWILNDRRTDNEAITGVELPLRLPTAFACSRDYAASILKEALSARNLRIPTDISLTSYDDYLYGDPLEKKLTTFHVDMVKMAEKAVQALLRNRKSPNRAMNWYVDSVLVERESVAPPIR